MSRRMYVYAALLMLCCPTLSLAQSVAAPAPQPLTIDGAVTHVYKSIGGTDTPARWWA